MFKKHSYPSYAHSYRSKVGLNLHMPTSFVWVLLKFNGYVFFFFFFSLFIKVVQLAVGVFCVRDPQSLRNSNRYILVISGWVGAELRLKFWRGQKFYKSKLFEIKLKNCIQLTMAMRMNTFAGATNALTRCNYGLVLYSEGNFSKWPKLLVNL